MPKKYSIYPIFSHDRKNIVKVCNIANEQNLKRLHIEFKVGARIFHYGIRRPIEQTTYEGKSAILLEWTDGYPLSQVISNGTFSVKDFIHIARDIVSALLAMHENYITHTNLTCDHIIYNPNTNSIKLIGFGSSVRFDIDGEKKVFLHKIYWKRIYTTYHRRWEVW